VGKVNRRPSPFWAFTMICGKKRMGGFQLQRRTRREQIAADHDTESEGRTAGRRTSDSGTGKWLGQVSGLLCIHAVPTTIGAGGVRSVLLNFGSVR